MAKCASALHSELQLDSFDTSLSLADVRVTRLETTGSRRVEGAFTSASRLSRGFWCEVVPDSADQLRGLRVTRLEML